MSSNTELFNALEKAVKNAIKEIGLSEFKKTSFFISNESNKT